ncbi:Lrp/AsnC family transcriptional regulator [Nitratireductor rhodophyticola]|uniref:Lrp/AsnC family transcriptional regulator, leucine-responsive regulatory protein n=3 Tax=Nitratireductor TaxID=245876 RepID=A0A1H4KA58_9HYPH|nr:MULTISPECIES: Lrp/AsnC family transcriptional regulator [Nitratireductor]MBY8916255.1 Lrp/AsnC family transcriptional regulator [Nitratireductor rhodophyticola]MEC9246366.1 Lrp/AsnC family transcriptional regulator [Pseudomonadota bacterium]EIM75210.1 transcriptional regulator, AsnC family protein [Nitratireductor aquibiodomus RA22]MBY8921618.1 Lrp/AsnC family transcriptional regulator [Nitratireductor rhodophyticola]WPZ15614.1 Lrp/AsnC family transcriptional regulator [Nitratireductor rhod
MDQIDHKIVTLLAEDARRSLADIGGVVGLSASAVNERIRRLSASGVIRRFTVDADPAALGCPVLVFIWVSLVQNVNEEAFRVFAAAHKAVEECHHVTGPWSYLIKARVPSLADVESVLEDMKKHGFLARSESVVALSTVEPGSFAPVEKG